ncbi:MAG: hypothetical protein ACK5ML_06805 [Lachnospiraceae bacterium]
MKIIPNHTGLQYTGRIDFDDPMAPIFVYVASSIRFRFFGTGFKILLKNRNA